MNTFIPNSYQTPNVLVDQVMPLVTPYEWVVLSFAVRRILGWHDSIITREAVISVSQFAKTGLARPTIMSALDELVKFGLLERIGEPDAKGQRWRLGFDNAIDVDGLRKRSETKHHINQKRTQNARSVALTVGQSDRPTPVSRIDRKAGQSDRHNKTQGYKDQDQTQDSIGSADKPRAGNASKTPPVKGRFTTNKYYAVNHESRQIGPKTYNKAQAAEKRAVLSERGYRMVLGSKLNADAKYLQYTILPLPASAPSDRNLFFDAIAIGAFGMKKGFSSEALGSDGGIIGKIITFIAEDDNVTYNDIVNSQKYATEMEYFCKMWREQKQGIDIPTTPDSFRRNWRKYRKGDLFPRMSATSDLVPDPRGNGGLVPRLKAEQIQKALDEGHDV